MQVVLERKANDDRVLVIENFVKNSVQYLAFCKRNQIDNEGIFLTANLNDCWRWLFATNHCLPLSVNPNESFAEQQLQTLALFFFTDEVYLNPIG